MGIQLPTLEKPLSVLSIMMATGVETAVGVLVGSGVAVLVAVGASVGVTV